MCIVIIIFATAISAQKNQSVCPKLWITGLPSALASGETATFSASLFGNYDDKKVQYKWSVNNGKIIEGQGTTVISLSTIGLDHTTITASVEVTGLPCGNLTASETGIGDPIPEKVLIDKFAKANNLKITDKLKKFNIRIHNNPSKTPYIINCGSSIEILNREKIIRGFIKSRKLKADRFVLLSNEKDTEIQTYFFLVPQGLEPPFPDCNDD